MTNSKSNFKMEKLKPKEEKRLVPIPAMKKKTF